jgi:hypothetical protein
MSKVTENMSDSANKKLESGVDIELNIPTQTVQHITASFIIELTLGL